MSIVWVLCKSFQLAYACGLLLQLRLLQLVLGCLDLVSEAILDDYRWVYTLSDAIHGSLSLGSLAPCHRLRDDGVWQIKAHLLIS